MTEEVKDPSQQTSEAEESMKNAAEAAETDAAADVATETEAAAAEADKTAELQQKIEALEKSLPMKRRNISDLMRNITITAHVPSKKSRTHTTMPLQRLSPKFFR